MEIEEHRYFLDEIESSYKVITFIIIIRFLSLECCSITKVNIYILIECEFHSLSAVKISRVIDLVFGDDLWVLLDGMGVVGDMVWLSVKYSVTCIIFFSLCKLSDLLPSFSNKKTLTVL